MVSNHLHISQFIRLQACVYFICLAFKQMYNDNIKIHVDYAILRMRERYRQRHKPDLDLHEE